MNLGQLHQYLGDMLAAGTDPSLPVIMPGDGEEAMPIELIDAKLVSGSYHGDPAPKMSAFVERSEACLLLVGLGFDIDTLEESHSPQWTRVDVP